MKIFERVGLTLSIFIFSLGIVWGAAGFPSQPTAIPIPVAEGGTNATTAASARTNLGLVIGTDVQAYNATLANVAGGTYTGDDSITTVGTITTGVWTGTDVAVPDGGTGAGTFTDAGVLIGNGTGAFQVTTAGTTGQVLTSNGAGVDPTFQTIASGDFPENIIISGAPRHDGTTTWTQTAGTWAFSASDPLTLLGGSLENTTNAQNDEIRKSNIRVPTTGTYAVRLLTTNDVNRAIATVLLDGASVGTVDLYTAATAYNTWSAAISLGSLTAGTAYRLDIKAATRNGSSSGWVISLQYAYIYRTL